jgi:hypothetical protein
MIYQFDTKDIIDLLWYIQFDDVNFDMVKQNDLLIQIYSAKGYLDTGCKATSIVDLDILSLLNTSDKDLRGRVDLGFDFVCKKCKKTHPMYEARCPHCHSILSFSVKPKLIKRMNIEENLSLQ